MSTIYNILIIYIVAMLTLFIIFMFIKIFRYRVSFTLRFRETNINKHHSLTNRF